MNQPDIGLKVSELRREKGLTQEQLADHCEVSVRTIQRIESGEVDPRTHTLTMLSKALDFNFEEDPTHNENLWLAALHLSSVFSIPIIPLMLWSWKKTQSFKIDTQGRQVLNFQITTTMTLFASVFVLIIVPIVMGLMDDAGIVSSQSRYFVILILCMPLPLILTGIFCTFQGILNAVRALTDKPIHYALAIPFIK